MTAITLKKIDAELSKFRTSRDALSALGHTIAMMIFDHAYASNDCTRALQLAQAMPKSWEPQLTMWFKAFTPILIMKSRDDVGLNAKFKAERKAEGGDSADKAPIAYAKWWKREDALATPFFKVINEPEPKQPLDFAALVAMVSRLGKMIETKIGKNEVKPEDVASAHLIANKVKAMTFAPVKPPVVKEVKVVKAKAAPRAKKGVGVAAPALAAVD